MTMGSSQSATRNTPSSSRQPQRAPTRPFEVSSSTESPPEGGGGVPGGIISYFRDRYLTTLTHTHLNHSPEDIQAVFNILHTRLGLPLELIPLILDHAEYYSTCRRIQKTPITVDAGGPIPRQKGGRQMEGWMSGQESELEVELGMDEGKRGLRDREGEVWYLASSPIGCGLELAVPFEMETETRRMGRIEEFQEKGFQEKGEMVDEETKESRSAGQTGPLPPDTRGNSTQVEPAVKQSVNDLETNRMPAAYVREVIVETMSRDQGWSSNGYKHYGTYEHSYSWFEVSLLRNGEEVPDSRQRIQNNVHAGQYFKAHRIVLGLDHPLLRAARAGDRVVLWVRAQYPGWRNSVQEAAITVASAPFPYSF